MARVKSKPTPLESYIPSEEEKAKVRNVVREIVGQLREALAGYGVEIAPVGSTAKDTFLAGESDIDIYVMGKRHREAYDVASAMFPRGHRKFGELLIWNFNYKGYDVDLVFIPPDYEKKDTLRHTEFFTKHLSPKDRDEVRRAKAFFKSYGVYGAEVGGIVGVAVEELVRRYGTLENICRLFVESNPEELWLQDPVLKRPRNLLASVSKSKWKKIRKACREFLETGKFTYRKYTVERFLEDYRGYRIVECERKLDRAVDYHTALSVCNSAGRRVQNLERDVEYDCEVFVGGDRLLVAFKATPDPLPPKREVCIPKKLTRAVEGFKKAHPDVELYEKGEYVCGLVNRKITNPTEEMGEIILSEMERRSYECRLMK